LFCSAGANPAALTDPRFHPPGHASPERLFGPIERVTFHSGESGSHVRRVRVKGQCDLVTALGSADSVIAVNSSSAAESGSRIGFAACHSKRQASRSSRRPCRKISRSSPFRHGWEGRAALREKAGPHLRRGGRRCHRTHAGAFSGTRWHRRKTQGSGYLAVDSAASDATARCCTTSSTCSRPIWSMGGYSPCPDADAVEPR